MKKIILALLALLLAFSFAACSSSNSSDRDYDNAMGSVDWGDGYYYDSKDNAVKKTYW